MAIFPPSEPDHRGQEYYYELTAAGGELAGPKLELLKSDGTQRSNEALRQEMERVQACLG